MLRPASAATRLLERGLQIGPRHFQRRGQPEQDSRKHRYSQSEDQDAGINPNFFQSRQVGGQNAKQKPIAPGGQQESERATGEGEDHTLDQQLPDDTSPSSSERPADGEFPRSA